jgi:ribonuclease P protein component
LDNCFPKSVRILKSKDYQRVYQAGRRKAGRFLQLFYCSNHLDWSRFGISVSKRFGKAFQRNRLKRRIRESLRTNRSLWPSGWDVIIHPRSSLKPDSLAPLVPELKALLASLGSRKEIGIPEKSHPE